MKGSDSDVIHVEVDRVNLLSYSFIFCSASGHLVKRIISERESRLILAS